MLSGVAVDAGVSVGAGVAVGTIVSVGAMVFVGRNSCVGKGEELPPQATNTPPISETKINKMIIFFVFMFNSFEMLIHYRTLFNFSNELHEFTRIFVFFRVNSRKFVAIFHQIYRFIKSVR